MSKEKVLDIHDLDIAFQTTVDVIHAICDTNTNLCREETVAIVGESGSGKSVTIRVAMDMLARNAVINHGNTELRHCHDDGTAEGVGILTRDKKWIRRHINDKWITMIFQSPMTSLDPTVQISRQVMEGMVQYYYTPRREAYRKAVQLSDKTGIENAEKCMKTYPYQLSGGMRQRVVVAIALVCNPDPLICDEPTVTLGATIQVKVIGLIHRVQKKEGLSVVYIIHDLGVTAKVADYVNVMYAGKTVERGKSNETFYDPRHPYTWGLLSAMSDLDTDDDRLYMIPGSSPNLLHEEVGDAFAPRNVYMPAIGDKSNLPVFQIVDSHYAATWLLDLRAPWVEMLTELK